MWREIWDLRAGLEGEDMAWMDYGWAGWPKRGCTFLKVYAWLLAFMNSDEVCTSCITSLVHSAHLIVGPIWMYDYHGSQRNGIVSCD